MGARGKNKFALWEELSQLRVSPDVSPVAIYKRLDSELDKDIEDRAYQVVIPCPDTKNGKRKSLRTPDRTRAIEKAEEECINLRVQLKMGVKIETTPVSKLVRDFLKMKESRVRGEWEGKKDGGLRSITKQRYKLIEGKLLNYFVPFIGANTNAKTISYKKFDATWEGWRRDNPTGRGNKKVPPKQSTLKDEMGMIREIWTWGQKNGYIEPTLMKPFEDVNLIPDKTNTRPTWEPEQWKKFSRRLRDWRKQRQFSGDEKQWWDTHTSYNLIFFLANSGLRIGEVFKLRWGDVEFYDRRKDQSQHKIFDNEQMGAYIQIHKSSKTGEREVNTNGGIYLHRIKIKSKFNKDDDFVITDLSGKQQNRKWFKNMFDDMKRFTNNDELTGKPDIVPYSIRHYYATQRIYAGVDIEFLAKNMGNKPDELRASYDKAITRVMGDELFKKRALTPVGKVRNAVDGMFQMYKGSNTKLRTELPVQEDPVFISDEE
jgi:integrase